MESGSGKRKCLEKNCRRGLLKRRLEGKRNSFMCTGVNKQLKTLAHQVGHRVVSKDAEDKLVSLSERSSQTYQYIHLLNRALGTS